MSTPCPCDLVDEYIRRKRMPAALELQYYADQPSLADAIDVAALCKTPAGKRHPHQYRIPPAARRGPSTICTMPWPT
jgi:hypothetical protein